MDNRSECHRKNRNGQLDIGVDSNGVTLSQYGETTQDQNRPCWSERRSGDDQPTGERGSCQRQA